ncbi:hypothetical protein ACS0TY_006921 [Phlomoides rotata]
MDRSNHHRVAQVKESDAMKTMIMTLMEKFDAFSSSSPRESLPPLVQERHVQEKQGVQEVHFMGRQNYQGGNYTQGKPNFQSQPQGQFLQYSQGKYNATSNFQGWSSSYNPHFKHHENFSYANQKAVVQFPPGFNPGAKLPNNEGRPSQDDAMEAMFKKMEEFMKDEVVQEEKEEVNEDPIEEEELELAKEDEEEKNMGTEGEKMNEKEEEEVRVPKWREAKEKKEDTKEVKLDHWGVPKTVVPPPFPQRSLSRQLAIDSYELVIDSYELAISPSRQLAISPARHLASSPSRQLTISP